MHLEQCCFQPHLHPDWFFSNSLFQEKRNVFHCHYLLVTYHSFVWSPTENPFSSRCSFGSVGWKEWKELRNKERYRLRGNFFHKQRCRGGWAEGCVPVHSALVISPPMCRVYYVFCIKNLSLSPFSNWNTYFVSTFSSLISNIHESSNIHLLQ